MVSNEERRKIAARLRSVTNEEYRMCFLEEILTGCVGAAYVYDSECQLDVRLMVNRLANLIEPEPERTCHITDYNEETDTSFLSCGHSVCEEHPNYCSECGARVVKKDC